MMKQATGLASEPDLSEQVTQTHYPYSVPSSITHAHLLRVVLSEAGEDRSLDILDAGCGAGDLVQYLQRNLGASSVCSGFDVEDHGVQPGDFFENAHAMLNATLPNIDWSNRLFLSESTMPWPFGDETFDFIVSNQVLEHVWDLDLFLREAARVLRPGGQLIALFPTRRVIYEGHVGVPFAHRIRDSDVRTSLMAFSQRLGIDRGRAIRDDPKTSYARAHSDYVDFLTRYRTFGELADAARRAKMRISHRYTADFYRLKLRSIAKRPLPERYTRRSASANAALFQILQCVSGVTLSFSRANEYDSERHRHKCQGAGART